MVYVFGKDVYEGKRYNVTKLKNHYVKIDKNLTECGKLFTNKWSSHTSIDSLLKTK